MITNLALFEGGAAAIHKLSKPYPHYNYEQTQAKIDHFHKSGTKPMTCAKIAQNGFVCPRLKDGVHPGGSACHCKAPAGLAFIPMTAEELKKALAKCKPKHDPVDDVMTSRQFINDFLYNADPSFAEVFINHEIKTDVSEGTI